MAKLVIYMDEYEVYGKFNGKPEVGEVYMVLEHKNLMTDAVSYSFADDNGKGWGGNLDNTVKRYHGWRGTYNNDHAEALGVRVIEKVTEYKNGNVRILFGEDLKPELD